MLSRPNLGAACGRFTAEEVIAIRDAYRRGEPALRIAGRVGTSRQSVSKIVHGRDYAWVPGAPTQEKEAAVHYNAREDWTADEDAEIASLLGKTDAEIGEAIGRSPAAVKRRRHKLGLYGPRGKSRRNGMADRYRAMDPIIREHWGKMPVQELAGIAGETYSIITKRAAEIGMPRLGTGNGPRKGKAVSAIRDGLRPKGYSDAYVEECRQTAPPDELRLIEGMHREGVLMVGAF